MPPIHHLILTSANPAQAKGYEAQLALREGEDRLGPVENWRVIPDPNGRRVGSGGATLGVMAQLAAEFLKEEPKTQSMAQLFAGKRIVIIHSGGDSRRLPAYAAEGKVFAPLPCPVPAQLRQAGDMAEAPATLFDLILDSLVALPCPPQGQVLVAAGDVLITFDPTKADFNHPGIVGVAFPADLARGAKHGVYVAKNDPQKGAVPVTGFLQKPNAEAAKKANAVDGVGRVLVDTGLVSIGPEATEQLLKVAGCSLGRGQLKISGLLRDLPTGCAPALDLYQEVLMALPKGVKQKDYLAMNGDNPTTRAVYAGLRGIPFAVAITPSCEFFHVGSSREFMAGVSTLSHTAEKYAFREGDHASIAPRAAHSGAFVFNAILASERTRLGDYAVVEGVSCNGPLVLPGPNLVTGLELGKSGLKLAPGLGLVGIPLCGKGLPRKGAACVVFGLDDSFKDGSSFLNAPLESWMNRHGITAADLWAKGTTHSLWTAKLWPVGERAWVQTCALKLTSETALDGASLTAWRKSKRLSLAEIIPATDHARLISHRQEVQRRVRAASVAERAQTHSLMPCEALLADLHTPAEKRGAYADLLTAAKASANPLTSARLLALADTISKNRARQEAGAGNLMDQALLHVAHSVSAAVEPAQPARIDAVREDQAVWATAPARIDLAGGWSDTPPICTEMGGSVVNLAVTLCDQYPIQCVVKRRAEPIIAISSIDLGARSVVESSAQLLAKPDPRRWDALAIAAIGLSGLAPASAKTPLAKHLQSIGGGFELTLFSALPKGSGMGTSSILSATVMAALAKATGRPLSHEALCARTLLLEQVLTTGGGWQDQVGGVVPGVKIARSRPGPDQRPTVHALPLPPNCTALFNDRSVLMFTGVQRMAKGILQGVVGRFLRREGDMLKTVENLKANAERLALALSADDANAAVQAIAEYGECKRGIDPGSTNARVEAVLRPFAKDIDARLLCGAGGGGFAMVIAKDASAAARIRHRLATRPPNPLAREFPFKVDQQGLKVTVL